MAAPTNQSKKKRRATAAQAAAPVKEQNPATAGKQGISSKAPHAERSYGRDADSEGFEEQRKKD